MSNHLDLIVRLFFGTAFLMCFFLMLLCLYLEGKSANKIKKHVHIRKI